MNYLNSASNPAGRNDELIRAVQRDSRGLLWIATDQGLSRLDRKTGQVVFYRHDARNVHSVSTDIVNAIREDRSGTLWFGTKGGGLNRFDSATGRFFGYRHDPLNPGEPEQRHGVESAGGPARAAMGRYGRRRPEPL